MAGVDEPLDDPAAGRWVFRGRMQRARRLAAVYRQRGAIVRTRVNVGLLVAALVLAQVIMSERDEPWVPLGPVWDRTHVPGPFVSNDTKLHGVSWKPGGIPWRNWESAGPYQVRPQPVPLTEAVSELSGLGGMLRPLSPETVVQPAVEQQRRLSSWSGSLFVGGDSEGDGEAMKAVQFGVIGPVCVEAVNGSSWLHDYSGSAESTCWLADGGGGDPHPQGEPASRSSRPCPPVEAFGRANGLAPWTSERDLQWLLARAHEPVTLHEAAFVVPTRGSTGDEYGFFRALVHLIRAKRALVRLGFNSLQGTLFLCARPEDELLRGILDVLEGVVGPLFFEADLQSPRQCIGGAAIVGLHGLTADAPLFPSDTAVVTDEEIALDSHIPTVSRDAVLWRDVLYAEVFGQEEDRSIADVGSDDRGAYMLIKSPPRAVLLMMDDVDEESAARLTRRVERLCWEVNYELVGGYPDTDNFAQKLSYMSTIGIVVGAHGNSLLRTTLMPPLGTILEIVPGPLEDARFRAGGNAGMRYSMHRAAGSTVNCQQRPECEESTSAKLTLSDTDLDEIEAKLGRAVRYTDALGLMAPVELRRRGDHYEILKADKLRTRLNAP